MTEGTGNGQSRSSLQVSSLRTLLVVVVLVTSAITITRKSPESIITDLSIAATSVVYRNTSFPTIAFGQDLSALEEAESTGVDLHLRSCGMTWHDYYAELPQADADEQNDHAFQWTVSGGAEYQASASIILAKWKSLGLDPVLVLGLDENTTKAVCDAGFFAVHWNAEKASYSRVADAKFSVAEAIAKRGYRGFFIEMDVFCRKNPVPYFIDRKLDLVNIGHGDVGYFVNIGVFMAAPKMGPFFEGLKKVLAYSKTIREHTNQANWTVEFFDQNIYMHCLPIKQAEDDDNFPAQFEYYLFEDTERKNDLLKHCQKFQDFSHHVVPHHVMSSHDPPTIYDSTYCLHPLASFPFTPLAFKLGVAKFFGWDPKPLGPDEKLLKVDAGDLEFNNCWGMVIDHENSRMDEHSAEHKVANYIALLVEIAETTGRTLVLPQYIRSKESWALPTHAIVDVRTLGVPYRSMTREESYKLMDIEIIYAAHNSEETFLRATSSNHTDAKVLSITKMCNVRDYKPPRLEARKKKMGWCFNKDLTWSRAVGAWMDFCQSY